MCLDQTRLQHNACSRSVSDVKEQRKDETCLSETRKNILKSESDFKGFKGFICSKDKEEYFLVEPTAYAKSHQKIDGISETE